MERDSNESSAYSFQTDFETYSIHGENMNEPVSECPYFAEWRKQINHFP